MITLPSRFLSLLALLTLVLGVAATGARAEDVAPDALVKRITNEVLDILKKDQALKNGDVTKAAEVVRQKVLPYFNFTHMTRLAIGRNWRQASAEQQKQLTDEFRTLLVRTYSNALTGYKNQTVDFKPLQMKPTDTDVNVRTEVRQAGAAAIPITYALEKTAQGWQFYDIEVSGISLVTNYRDSFNAEINQNGIDGLIKSLHNKNQAGIVSKK